MVLVLVPFGISITNCSSRNYTKIRLPLQPPPLRREAVRRQAFGSHPGEVGRNPEFRLLNTATLWGEAVDQVQHAALSDGGEALRPTGQRIVGPQVSQLRLQLVANCLLRRWFTTWRQRAPVGQRESHVRHASAATSSVRLR